MERLTAGQAILQTVHTEGEAEIRKKIVFVRRMVALTFLMVGMFTMFSFAHGLMNKDTNAEEIKTMQKQIAQYDKVDVFIQDGDRAWNIQQKLTPGKDTRDMLDLVAYVNHMDNIGDIKAGEVITFLKPKKSK